MLSAERQIPTPLSSFYSNSCSASPPTQGQREKENRKSLGKPLPPSLAPFVSLYSLPNSWIDWSLLWIDPFWSLRFKRAGIDFRGSAKFQFLNGLKQFLPSFSVEVGFLLRGDRGLFMGITTTVAGRKGKECRALSKDATANTNSKSKKNRQRKKKIQRLFDTCKEVFSNSGTNVIPSPQDIERLKTVLGTSACLIFTNEPMFWHQKRFSLMIFHLLWELSKYCFLDEYLLQSTNTYYYCQ